MTSKTFSQLSHHLNLKNRIFFLEHNLHMFVKLPLKCHSQFYYFNYHWDILGTFKLLLFSFSIYLQNLAPPTGIIGWPELLKAITIIRQNCDISSSSDTKTQKRKNAKTPFNLETFYIPGDWETLNCSFDWPIRKIFVSSTYYDQF